MTVHMVDLIHWHTFDGKMLGPSSTVVDLGANRGEFLSKVQKAYGCNTLVAVEPNPELFKSLANRAELIAINAAVGGSSGEANFTIDDNDLASRVVQEAADGAQTNLTVKLITLADVFRSAGISNIDLLKVDIEGQEVAMIDATEDELLLRIGQITIEFHDFCGLVSSSEVKRIIKRLRRLGFHSARMSRVGHQDTWLINGRLLHVGPKMKAKLFVLKYSRGALRIWHKLTKGSNWYLMYD